MQRGTHALMRSTLAAPTRRAFSASVEASGKHVPWGGLGSGTYTAATKGCFDVIARTQPLVKTALGQALESRVAKGTANNTPFAIADFGTADGGTSIPLMRSIVAAVRAAEPSAPIVMHYEDQAANDWQYAAPGLEPFYQPACHMKLLLTRARLTADRSLYKLVQGDIPNGPQTYMDGSIDNVYVLCSGSSFYQQCFAPASIDLSFCATAMHWLTTVPCEIPDAIHSACSTDVATRSAFAAQAAKDWEHILVKRARELKSGGQFVVANFAVDDKEQFLGTSARVAQSMHHTFSELWLETAGKQIHSATNFCNEYRPLEACVAPFETASSAVGAEGLTLISAETDLVECPFHTEWVRGDVTDAHVQAANFVPTTRTWSNSTFESGAMACGKSPSEAARLADEMFARYEARVAEAPQEHAMDYVHSYLHVAKQ